MLNPSRAACSRVSDHYMVEESLSWSDIVKSVMPVGSPQSNPFEQFDSNRPFTSTGDIESQQNGFSIGGTLNTAKAFVIGRPEPEPQGWVSVFNFMPNDASYCNATIAF